MNQNMTIKEGGVATSSPQQQFRKENWPRRNSLHLHYIHNSCIYSLEKEEINKVIIIMTQ